mmetsp:Transcript_4153/g.7928  ORF Transcript_4153/g.7928 Transcript_4153/m.7928 type:complete len:302 (+) Transcript_4153:703-1608(+)
MLLPSSATMLGCRSVFQRSNSDKNAAIAVTESSLRDPLSTRNLTATALSSETQFACTTAPNAPFPMSDSNAKSRKGICLSPSGDSWRRAFPIRSKATLTSLPAPVVKRRTRTARFLDWSTSALRIVSKSEDPRSIEDLEERGDSARSAPPKLCREAPSAPPNEVSSSPFAAFVSCCWRSNSLAKSAISTSMSSSSHVGSLTGWQSNSRVSFAALVCVNNSILEMRVRVSLRKASSVSIDERATSPGINPILSAISESSESSRSNTSLSTSFTLRRCKRFLDAWLTFTTSSSARVGSITVAT